VVALNSAPCGQCYFCERGQENLCDDLLFNNGAYAEFIRIPARIVAKNTLHVPDHVPLEHAALTEPLACAVHGFEDSRPHPATRLPSSAAARWADDSACGGAGRLRGHRHRQARRPGGGGAQLGAAHVVQTTSIRKAIAKPARSLPKNRGVDIAIEAVGVPEAWQEAVELVRKGGTVNFFGGCAVGTHVTLDTNRIHY
jgi:L-iditol 2-dehydrogenase